MSESVRTEPSRLHSLNPSTKTRHRRFENAAGNEGFTSADSACALMSLCPIPESFLQAGMNPKRSMERRRSSQSFRTTVAFRLGARL